MKKMNKEQQFLAHVRNKPMTLKDLEKAKSYYRMAAKKGQSEAKKALERLGE